MPPSSLARLISIARGETPADLLFSNARIVNVFNGEIERGDVAISEGTIAGIGDYSQAKETIDLEGRYLAPAFINGHTHLESSMLDIPQYARAVVPHGTLSIVTDLHEIANVCGLAGIRYVLNCARQLPINIFLMAPSCVPASPLETSGADLGSPEIRQILKLPECIGLGEVMNFPGVIAGESSLLDKISLAKGHPIDGHAPGVSGKSLNAYISAGIHSDHESTSLGEAREKLARGMYVMIREGTSAKNLEALLPLVTDRTYKRCLLVVDDRSATDLLEDGDIDAVVRKAVRLGLEPVRAIQMATINAAEYFKLDRLGAVAAGYPADLIVLDDLLKLEISLVFRRGKLVAKEGSPLFSCPQCPHRGVIHTVTVKPFNEEALRISALRASEPVIEVIPGQIVTRKIQERVKIADGEIVSDTKRDILKLVVVERHHATGNIGTGLVRGFGLKRGALASSIAHDSHNIIAVGVTDSDIMTAINRIQNLQGGLVVVADEKVLAELALPVAGLLSIETLEAVAAKLAKLDDAARELGTVLPSPFGILSFLALPVIPEIKLTDRGLIDVNKFDFI